MAPFGYNVVLNAPYIFKGYIPLPYGTHSLPDFSGTTVTLTKVFVRPQDILKPNQNGKELEIKLRSCFENIRFGKVTTSKPDDSKTKILYYMHYDKNGKVHNLTHEEAAGLGKEDSDRIVKVPEFFFAFAQDIYDHPANSKSYHLSIHRFADVQFTKEKFWQEPGTKPVARPTNGTLVCGVCSGRFGQNGNAESFDYWFVCSEQFRLLVDLCMGRVKMPLDEALRRLEMPKNEANLPISCEVPESRYLYAAIWYLMAKGVTKLPEDWRLPKRYSSKNPQVSLTFEAWWPEHFLSL
jgi:hypothetical protein